MIDAQEIDVDNTVSTFELGSSDLHQYTKWFELQECDFALNYQSGAWFCSAWLRDGDVANSLIKSIEFSTPIAAMRDCYYKMKEAIAAIKLYL
jgi:hypothetical protein